MFIPRLIKANIELATNSGILIAVPIPESASADGEKIEGAIQAALKQCAEEGIKGKHVTPFVLDKINQISGGKSLESNLALVENNARAGAQIAVELTKVKRQDVQPSSVSST